jgi:putative ribosome biogenesis GTPase RsgA
MGLNETVAFLSTLLTRCTHIHMQVAMTTASDGSLVASLNNELAQGTVRLIGQSGTAAGGRFRWLSTFPNTD